MPGLFLLREVKKMADNYDGYYEDRVPDDDGKVNTDFDKSVIKKIAVIVLAAAVVITLSVLAMKYL
jgi:hypothetical protein